MFFYDDGGYLIKWRWYDLGLELFCGLLMITAFCWDWKNIMRIPGGTLRTGIPNPFAWWLYVPAYLFSVIYFALRLKQLLSVNESLHEPRA